MTTDRDFDRITMAWLADGPEELPDRVLDSVVDEVHLTRQRHGLRLPWRFPTMTMPARVAALVAVGALILATLVAVGGAGGGKPAPSPSQAAVAPAPSPAPTTLETIGIPVLDTAFTSPRNGFSMQVPGIWNLTPATASWQPGTTLQWGDPALDAIQGDDVRFVASAQKLLPEQTPEQWLKAYCLGTAADTGQCDSVPADWEEIKIAGTKAYIDLDGVPAAAGTIVPGGAVFDAVVPLTRHVYAFTLDGDVDRQVFDAFLKTVQLSPADVIDLPALTERFTSPTYGYSIGTLPAWTVTPTTKQWHDTSNGEFMDSIDNTGSHGIGAMSQGLGDRSFDEFVAAFEAEQHAAGCGGGDPSTWQSISIGDQTGVFYDNCNSAEALVQAGDRVYLFEMGHASSDAAQLFSLADFKQLLTTVAFDPASAKD